MTDPRIQSCSEVARHMQIGDFSVEIPTGGSDDVGQLGEALHELAKNLERRFREIQTLAHVTEEINAGLVLDEVLNRVFEIFRSIIPYNLLMVARCRDWRNRSDVMVRPVGAGSRQDGDAGCG